MRFSRTVAVKRTSGLPSLGALSSLLRNPTMKKYLLALLLSITVCTAVKANSNFALTLDEAEKKELYDRYVRQANMCDLFAMLTTPPDIDLDAFVNNVYHQRALVYWDCAEQLKDAGTLKYIPVAMPAVAPAVVGPVSTVARQLPAVKIAK